MKKIILSGLLLFIARFAFSGDVPFITNETLKKYEPGVVKDEPSKVQTMPNDKRDAIVTSTQFKSNGNGTVTDTVTQFMWQQTDDGIERNWAEATSYCEKLNLGRHGGWRLPTTEEFKTIIDSERENPAIDQTYFPSTKSAYYWTCATNGKDKSNAWVIGFQNGHMTSDYKTNKYYVRCVR
jgi:hypothetical protein